MIFFRPELRAAGFSIPVDITLSTEESSVRQRFNRFSIEPAWSWGALRIGDFNMSHSLFALNGITLRGAGLDMTPGGFRFSSAYGSASRSVEQVSAFPQRASYSRTAWAVKIGAGRDDDRFIDLNVFRAVDDASSVGLPGFITPEENLVVSVNMNVGLLGNRISLQTEQAAGLHSRDTRSRRVDNEDIPDWLQQLFPTRLSTRYGLAHAYSAGVDAESFRLETRYRYIQPGFVTLGSPWLQNDVREWAVSPNLRLLENRLTVRASHTGRRDNLENDKRFTTRSARTTVGATVRASRRFTLSTSAGFSRSMIDDDDGTRNRTWQNRSWQLQPVWNFMLKDIRNTLSLSWRHQQGSDRIARDGISRTYSAYSAGLRLTTQLSNRLSLGPGFTLLSHSRDDFKSTTRSFSLGGTWRVLNPDLTIRLDTGLTGNTGFDAMRSSQWAADASIGYRPWPGHSLTLRLSNSGFGSDSALLNSFTEFRGQLQYTRVF